jgi:hypothetical protein
MAKRVILKDFIKSLKPNYVYSRDEIKSLSELIGLQIPSEFWKECLLSRGKWGVITKDEPESVLPEQDIDTTGFTFTVTKKSDILQVIEVVHDVSSARLITSTSVRDLTVFDKINWMKRIEPVKYVVD